MFLLGVIIIIIIIIIISSSSSSSSSSISISIIPDGFDTVVSPFHICDISIVSVNTVHYMQNTLILSLIPGAKLINFRYVFVYQYLKI